MNADIGRGAFLFAAATLGGALNSVAGGGSFIVLPALLFAGVGPVSANATTTIALWPGALASVFAYRREVRRSRALLLVLGVPSLLGGCAGALLLMGTSDSAFMRLLPWLLLLATAIFSFGGKVTARLRRGGGPGRGHYLALIAFQALVATYGGYFGGGMGIMMLAALTVSGMTDIHGMNGLKASLGSLINGAAVAVFACSRAVAWHWGLLMLAGAVAGGYGGAAAARRVPAAWARRGVAALTWAMTAYFFWRSWRAGH